MRKVNSDSNTCLFSFSHTETQNGKLSLGIIDWLIGFNGTSNPNGSFIAKVHVWFVSSSIVYTYVYTFVYIYILYLYFLFVV